MTELIIFAIALGGTYLGVAAFRLWSARFGILDVPNDRSSHDMPVPRGAGIVIVIVSLLLYSFTTLYLTNNFNVAFVLGAFLVAFISWLDDLYTLSSLIRLLIHSVAAVILIIGSGYSQEIYVPGIHGTVTLGGFGFVIAFVWIVWMINAYNFMDGIDGLAGSQAVVGGIAWLVFGYLFQFDNAYYFGGIIAFSSVGFLIHNWAPAKVFMGDVGSAFLGFTFAALSILETGPRSEWSPFLFFAGISFVWFFLFDTVFTFTRRALRMEKVWMAHREHVYQKMVVAGYAHSTVTLIYTALALSVAASVLIGILLRGIWEHLSVLAILLLSALLLFGSREKKD